MEILLLGVLASLATEVITYIDAKLSNTVLKGDGALLLSAVIALVIAAIKVFSTNAVTWTGLGAEFGQVWAMSQVFFLVVVQTLHLDVSSTATQ